MDLGFSVSRSDTSLFILRTASVTIFVLIYVDDILITGSSPEAIQQIIHSLSESFPVKDLGSLSYFLGVEVHHTSSGICLSQKKYISDLLDRTLMSNSRPLATPMAPSTKLSQFDGHTFDDVTLYRSIAGSLQYLSFTRPDITFAVNKICQFMHCPKDVHWQAIKRILRYLRGTIDHGLHITRSSSFHISAFTDADWGGCPDDRRSTGGFCLYLGSKLINWSSKKQATIARSSTEAEYKSLALATCDIIWVQSLLSELGIFLKSSPVLHCDNIGATYLAANPVMHSRTKHIDLDFHFVRERVAIKALQIAVVSSKDQLADIMTKPLPAPRFQQLCSSLTVLPLQLGSRGGVRASTVDPTSAKE